MILYLLPDDGRRTWPKHVAEKTKSAYKNCCVFSDKDRNSLHHMCSLTTQKLLVCLFQQYTSISISYLLFIQTET